MEKKRRGGRDTRVAIGKKINRAGRERIQKQGGK